MADVHRPEVRSYNMSRIRAKDTNPEMIVRRFIFAKGYRYRLHVKSLPGKPDIVLKKYNTIIFINGCFWHGHEGCRYFVVPKTRTDWWLSKINQNKMNDHKTLNLLNAGGWRVIVIYECELKPGKKEITFHKILNYLNSGYTSN